MNPPKCTDEDYINFIIATLKQLMATEAARVQPESRNAPAHDAFTRLLSRLEPDAETLWQEAATQIDKASGVLVLDDSTLDKPFSKRNALASRHWATSIVEMNEEQRIDFAKQANRIEQYHRGIKQFCLIERTQARRRRPWLNYILLCLRAFLRLEYHCYQRKVSWHKAKVGIIREAIRAYLANPTYSLIPTA